MRAWITDALDLLKHEPRIALVSVVAVSGSAPREAGAKMVVTRAQARGTIGGGALEHTCISQARIMIDREGEHARVQDFPLGPLLGQCCGGRVGVALEILTASDRSWLERAADYEARGVAYRLDLPLDGAREAIAGWPPDVTAPGVTLLADPDAQPRRAWRRRTEFSRPQLRPVMLIGGGHVGAALAMLLRALPVQLTWIDTRAGEAESGMGGAALCDDPVGAVEAAPPNSIFLIMTHSHALDFDLVAAALRRDDALYCGVIGSKTKRQRFMNRLARAGLSDARRDRLVCPIGAVGLTGKEPAVVALAVATEVMLCVERHEQRA